MKWAGIAPSIVVWTVAFVGLYALSAIPGSTEYRTVIGGLIVTAAILFTTVMSLSPQR